MAETALAGFLKAGVATRHGAREAAANHTRAALAAVDWDERQCVLQRDLWSVYLDDSLDWMVAYAEECDVDGAPGGRVVIGSSTWATLNYDNAAPDAFLDDMEIGGTGMKFVVTDRGAFQRAVRAEAAAKGNDDPRAKDALTELGERANALVIQAASLNAAPTPIQRLVFAVRYAQLVEDLAKLESRVEAVRARVDLAGTAIYDTTRD